MSLSDKDFERIEKLISLFQQGVITRNELDASRNAILEASSGYVTDTNISDVEKPNEFLEDLSSDFPTSKSPSRLKVQDDDNFESLENDHVISASRRPTDNLGYTKINNFADEQTNNSKDIADKRPKTTLSNFGKLKEADEIITNSHDDIHDNSKKKTIAILASVGIIAIIITAGIIHFGHKREELTETITNVLQTQNQISLTNDNMSSSFFRPIFGPLAVKDCQIKCTDSDTQALATCNTACEQLNFAEYVAETNNNSPETDSKTIIASCKQSVTRIASHGSYGEWKTQVNETINLLKNFNSTSISKNIAEAEERFTEISKTNQEIRVLPDASPENKQLTKMLAFATCLKIHLSIAEIGRITTSPNSSNNYYQNFTKILSPISEKVDSSIISRAKNL